MVVRMKCLPFVLAATVAGVLSTACSRQPAEVPAAVAAEAAAIIDEAQFAMRINENARAEELIRRALGLRDDLPEYWVSLGMALRKQDKTDAARKAYEKALKIHGQRYENDRHPDELAQQAFVLGLLGRADEAFRLLEKARADHPGNESLNAMADPQGLPRTFQTPEFKALAVDRD